MKVCVFGAGGIGGYLAVCLHRAGVGTSVIARGAPLAAIRENGLRLRATGNEAVARILASDNPSEFGPQDAVFVTVKAPALPSVAATIAPLLGPNTAVVFVMNGAPWWYFHNHGGPLDDYRLSLLDPGDRLRMAVAPRRVIGGVIYAACEVVAPGVVALAGSTQRLILGESTGALTPRARALAERLSAGGLASSVSPVIRDEIWSKLMNNIATGPLAVLTGAAINEVAAEPQCADLLRRMLRETASVAQALGRNPELDIEARIASFRTLRHKPSILQDMERGRVMEVDAQWQAPLDLARLAGVATPVLNEIIALAMLRARAAAAEQPLCHHGGRVKGTGLKPIEAPS
ncbi:MAG: 2-dehydropantoate 2-reductase [Rhodobacteraceae bacterium]|nr:2-dehydropantoate 2-reductase [Paracoccaceae bacterium]